MDVPPASLLLQPTADGETLSVLVWYQRGRRERARRAAVDGYLSIPHVIT
ncbi:unnamed protein product [Ectocarpus sp. CCAP 1310/34]|nr:unnamed protein product [Ectocarpus sp. CCAP 1310/34]